MAKNVSSVIPKMYGLMRRSLDLSLVHFQRAFRRFIGTYIWREKRMELNSHDLTAKYAPVSPELRSSLKGEGCRVPDFGTPDPAHLSGLRVAIVMTHGPELPEFDVPCTYLRERGAAISIVTQDWLFDYPPDKNHPG